jgi:hypothetical protein
VMPFYAANTGPLPPQPGGMVDPAGGFAPPLRDRFPNSVWHPASGADPNSVGMSQAACMHIASNGKGCNEWFTQVHEIYDESCKEFCRYV